MPERKIRYAEEIKKEIAILIHRNLKDPRIPAFTSITKVDVTKDLSVCKIYISTLGSKHEREEAIKGLTSATGYIKRELSKKIRFRVMPNLVFIPDDSIEYAIRMTKLINDTVHGDKKSETE